VDRADRYTMLWTNDFCRFMVGTDAVGKPLRFVYGGYNKQTSFSDMNVRAGDYVYPIRVRNGVMYVIARMRVQKVTDRYDYHESHPDEDRLFQFPSGNEVLAGSEATPVRFDVAVPPEILERIRYRSRKAERSLRYVENGRLISSIGVQGIFRLTAATVRDFDALLSGEYRRPAQADGGTSSDAE